MSTGDFDGHLAIWDLECLNAGPIFSVKAHEKIINCIDGVAGLGIGRGAPEIVTGSRDGTVKVWDPRLKDRPVACMQPRNASGSTGLLQFHFNNYKNHAIGIYVFVKFEQILGIKLTVSAIKFCLKFA